MYYIKQIEQPNYNIPCQTFEPNKFINFKKERIVMLEQEGLLWVWGTYFISGNFVLPNFSFYLDIDSSFGYFEKINLKPLKTLYEDKNNGGNTNYFIYKYYFLFSINLRDSYIGTNETRPRDITFQFIPIFNQNVLTDFNISVDEKLMKDFIFQINNAWTVDTYRYANTYDVSSSEWTKIFLNSLPSNNNEKIFAKIHDQNESAIIKDFISLITNDYPKRISGEIEINYNLEDKQPKQIKEIIDSFELSSSSFSLQLKNWYEYDPYRREFIKKKNYGSGIYSAYDCKVNVKCKLIINYEGLKRTFYANYDFDFSAKETMELKSLLLIKNSYSNEEKNMEVQSDKIN